MRAIIAVSASGIRAAEGRVVGLVPRPRRARRVDRDAADLRGERPDLDPELAQERPRDAARRDPCRRLARRRALEHVAHVVEAVLQGAGEVRVPRPDAGDRLGALGAVVGERRELGRLVVAQRPDLHHPGPVLPVAVRDLEQDRRAERAPVPDAAQDPRPVVLDGLARAATVAALATGEVDGEVVLGEREAGGHALDHGAQHRAVALAGRDEPEAVHVAAGAGQPAAGSAAGRRRPKRPPPARPRPTGGPAPGRRPAPRP